MADEYQKPTLPSFSQKQVLPVGLYLNLSSGSNTATGATSGSVPSNLTQLTNVMAMQITRTASERTQMDVTLQYETMQQYLTDAPFYFALAAAGLGQLTPVLPIGAEGQGLQMPLGLSSYGDLALYNVSSEYPHQVNLKAVGNEAYTGIFTGQGKSWPKDDQKTAKVVDILREIAEYTDDKTSGGKKAWDMVFMGVPETYFIQRYSEAGRTPEQVVADLCRGFGLTYWFTQESDAYGKLKLHVMGPGAIYASPLDPDAYPASVKVPAWIRITNGVTQQRADEMARAALASRPWQAYLADSSGGKRNPTNFLGKPLKKPSATDGLALLSYYSYLQSIGKTSTIDAEIKAYAKSKNLEENWKEAIATLDKIYATNPPLELMSLNLPSVSFDLPPRDSFSENLKQDGQSSSLSNNYLTLAVPDLVTAQAIVRQYGLGGVTDVTEGERKKEANEKADPNIRYFRFTMPLPADAPEGTVPLDRIVSSKTELIIIQDQKTMATVSLGTTYNDSTAGAGDLLNYYPYRVSLTVPGSGFINIFQAVELWGYGGFLDGWWQVLSIRAELSNNAWTMQLELGRKDFPFSGYGR